MKIIKLSNLSEQQIDTIVNRASYNDQQKEEEIIKIIEKVRASGDNALFEAGKKWSGGDKYTEITISAKEFKEAFKKVDLSAIKALKQMKKNIYTVHQDLFSKTCKYSSPEKGISVWAKWRPIESVGLYIPGGRAKYPSCLLMSAIPALIAGCKNICVCTPADANGKVPEVILAAAGLLGLKNIFKVGGAEAIAAMAFGTETIPKVDKIFGAGNSYVTIAKKLVQTSVAIDMPAGPSEVMILADETANPKFIAADLLADAEHGDDSKCVLVSTSRLTLSKSIDEVEKQITGLGTAGRIKKSLADFGFFILVDSLQEGIDLANKYAPEHLSLMTKNNSKYLSKINSAGSVFLGKYASKSSGDYATGANHVLPTSGFAKSFSPLSVESFGKRMQIQKCTKRGLKSIQSTIESIANIEGLPAHKNSTAIRFRRE